MFDPFKHLSATHRERLRVDGRFITDRLDRERIQACNAACVRIMNRTPQQIADSLLEADQERRGVNRPWANR